MEHNRPSINPPVPRTPRRARHMRRDEGTGTLVEGDRVTAGELHNIRRRHTAATTREGFRDRTTRFLATNIQRAAPAGAPNEEDIPPATPMEMALSMADEGGLDNLEANWSPEVAWYITLLSPGAEAMDTNTAYLNGLWHDPGHIARLTGETAAYAMRASRLAGITPPIEEMRARMTAEEYAALPAAYADMMTREREAIRDNWSMVSYEVLDWHANNRESSANYERHHLLRLTQEQFGDYDEDGADEMLRAHEAVVDTNLASYRTFADEARMDSEASAAAAINEGVAHRLGPESPRLPPTPSSPRLSEGEPSSPRTPRDHGPRGDQPPPPPRPPGRMPDDDY